MPASQKLVGHFEREWWLVRDSEEARAALPAFQNHLKLLSWLLLHIFDVPSLSGVIVQRWSSDVAAAVLGFAKEFGTSELLIRSDKAPETGSYPRGGFVVPFERLAEECSRFLELDRVVYLLEPRSPFDDLYSMSLHFERERIHVEIVGPGFDASDLKRGDENPHESFILVKQPSGFIDEMSHEVVEPSDYRRSWLRRVNKVAEMLGVASENDDRQVAEIGSELKRRHEPLLLEAREAYRPIDRALLAMALEQSMKLIRHLDSGGYMTESLVISMSYASTEALPVYWDIVWPHSKYAPSAGS